MRAAEREREAIQSRAQVQRYVVGVALRWSRSNYLTLLLSLSLPWCVRVRACVSLLCVRVCARWCARVRERVHEVMTVLLFPFLSSWHLLQCLYVCLPRAHMVMLLYLQTWMCFAAAADLFCLSNQAFSRCNSAVNQSACAVLLSAISTIWPTPVSERRNGKLLGAQTEKLFSTTACSHVLLNHPKRSLLYPPSA